MSIAQILSDTGDVIKDTKDKPNAAATNAKVCSTESWLIKPKLDETRALKIASKILRCGRESWVIMQGAHGQGKTGKMVKKIPCREKSGNLKISFNIGENTGNLKTVKISGKTKFD